MKLGLLNTLVTFTIVYMCKSEMLQKQTKQDKVITIQLHYGIITCTIFCLAWMVMITLLPQNDSFYMFDFVCYIDSIEVISYCTGWYNRKVNSLKYQSNILVNGKTIRKGKVICPVLFSSFQYHIIHSD